MAERRGACKDKNYEPGNLRLISDSFPKILCDLKGITKLFFPNMKKFFLTVVLGFKTLINFL